MAKRLTRSAGSPGTGLLRVLRAVRKRANRSLPLVAIPCLVAALPCPVLGAPEDELRVSIRSRAVRSVIQQPRTADLLTYAYLRPASADGPADECGERRYLKDETVTLVLSGGVSKGIAFVGAMQFLDDLGVRVDRIVGTSIGAVIGAVYAAGYPAASIAAYEVDGQDGWPLSRLEAQALEAIRWPRPAPKGGRASERRSAGRSEDAGQTLRVELTRQQAEILNSIDWQNYDDSSRERLTTRLLYSRPQKKIVAREFQRLQETLSQELLRLREIEAQERAAPDTMQVDLPEAQVEVLAEIDWSYFVPRPALRARTVLDRINWDALFTDVPDIKTLDPIEYDLWGLTESNDWIPRYVDRGIKSGQNIYTTLNGLLFPAMASSGNCFGNLYIPLRVLATDSAQDARKELHAGNLINAVRASMSFPLVFSPTYVSPGNYYRDGGILSNYAVDTGLRWTLSGTREASDAAAGDRRHVIIGIDVSDKSHLGSDERGVLPLMGLAEIVADFVDGYTTTITRNTRERVDEVRACNERLLPDDGAEPVCMIHTEIDVKGGFTDFDPASLYSFYKAGYVALHRVFCQHLQLTSEETQCGIGLIRKKLERTRMLRTAPAGATSEERVRAARRLLLQFRHAVEGDRVGTRSLPAGAGNNLLIGVEYRYPANAGTPPARIEDKERLLEAIDVARCELGEAAGACPARTRLQPREFSTIEFVIRADAVRVRIHGWLLSERRMIARHQGSGSDDASRHARLLRARMRDTLRPMQDVRGDYAQQLGSILEEFYSTGRHEYVRLEHLDAEEVAVSYKRLGGPALFTFGYQYDNSQKHSYLVRGMLFGDGPNALVSGKFAALNPAESDPAFTPGFYSGLKGIWFRDPFAARFGTLSLEGYSSKRVQRTMAALEEGQLSYAEEGVALRAGAPVPRTTDGLALGLRWARQWTTTPVLRGATDEQFAQIERRAALDEQRLSKGTFELEHRLPRLESRILRASYISTEDGLAFVDGRFRGALQDTNDYGDLRYDIAFDFGAIDRIAGKAAGTSAPISELYSLGGHLPLEDAAVRGGKRMNHIGKLLNAEWGTSAYALEYRWPMFESKLLKILHPRWRTTVDFVTDYGGVNENYRGGDWGVGFVANVHLPFAASVQPRFNAALGAPDHGVHVWKEWIFHAVVDITF